jgi:hypothetical protein
MMSDATIGEAFATLRDITPQWAHELLDLLEQRLKTAELAAAANKAKQEPDTHSRRVNHLTALDGYDVSDPKRFSLIEGGKNL